MAAFIFLDSGQEAATDASIRRGSQTVAACANAENKAREKALWV
jgi:hypothetical protein